MQTLPEQSDCLGWLAMPRMVAEVVGDSVSPIRLEVEVIERVIVGVIHARLGALGRQADELFEKVRRPRLERNP